VRKRLLASTQTVVDTAAFGLGMCEAQLDPCPDFLCGIAQERLLK
jgi:hypothetical protein